MIIFRTVNCKGCALKSDRVLKNDMRAILRHLAFPAARTRRRCCDPVFAELLR